MGNSSILDKYGFSFHLTWETWEMGYSRADIENWKKDGWSFRVKVVKGNRYITRRKGKLETSLGRYSDELWSMVEETTIENTREEERVDNEKRITDMLSIIRPALMSRVCRHIVDGYCYFWRSDEPYGFFSIADDIGDGFYRKIDEGDSSFWVFKAVPFYCKNCSAFKMGSK